METFNSFPAPNDQTPQETMTAHPISKEFIYAGFWRRLIAAMIDGAILAVPALIFNIAIPYVGGAILALFFRPIFDASPIGATPGRA
ncbi:MAG: RDD family protein, partial [Bdellovibrionaceae bacterium]|nr:RDD family protein [Pseudobdellovibrionaceae bacterium]